LFLIPLSRPRQAVEAAVEAATGLGGWVLTPVGGAARGKGGGHDADFLLHRCGPALLR
jgi:hypothetical protein